MLSYVFYCFNFRKVPLCGGVEQEWGRSESTGFLCGDLRRPREVSFWSCVRDFLKPAHEPVIYRRCRDIVVPQRFARAIAEELCGKSAGIIVLEAVGEVVWRKRTRRPERFRNRAGVARDVVRIGSLWTGEFLRCAEGRDVARIGHGSDANRARRLVPGEAYRARAEFPQRRRGIDA